MKKSFILYFLLIAINLSPTEIFSKDTSVNNGYTINYPNVSAIEYINFVSKVCKVNFIYNVNDLQFSVSVVSQDPIEPNYIMSTLIQILRINNLSIIEENNNLVIHPSDDVRELATVTNIEDTTTPIATHVYRIEEANVSSIAKIIKSMISKQAILEVSPETRQIIVTDVSPNLKKISELITQIDSPHSSVEIKAYKVKSNNPDSLIELASQIMKPLVGDNKYNLISHGDSDTIYIISTPTLINKTESVLTSLDIPPKQKSKKKISSANIFIYKSEFKSAKDLKNSLEDIAKSLHENGFPEAGIVESLQNAKVIEKSNSLLFNITKEQLAKLKEIITSIDIKTKKERTSFFTFKPKNITTNKLLESISKLEDSIEDTNPDLYKTLKTAKELPSTNTIYFHGDSITFNPAKELLTSLDSEEKIPVSKTFYIYKIKNIPHEHLLSALKNIAEHLDDNKTSKNVVNAIDNVKYVKETNSLLFTANTKTLDKIKELLPTFDVKTEISELTKNPFFITYKPEHVSCKFLISSLKDTAKQLEEAKLTDRNFMKAIESIQFIDTTNSILFTGDKESLSKIENLIKGIDVPHSKKQSTFFIYSLKSASKDQVESYLNSVNENLKDSDPDLSTTIDSKKWLTDDHSFMFTGPSKALDEIKNLLEKFDSSHPEKQSKFFIYHIKTASKEQIENYLNSVSDNLKNSNPNLYLAIDSMKWIPNSYSFMFTGSPVALDKLKALLEKFDSPSEQEKIQGKSQNTYFLYKLQNVPAEIIEEDVDKFVSKLDDKKLSDPDFLNVLDNIKIIPETNSLLLTGTPEALEKAKNLIARYDIPRKGISTHGTTEPSSQFYMYQPKFITPSQLEKNLKDIANNLKKSGLANASFLNAINTMRYVSSTKSVVFTGNQTALDHIKSIISSLDIEISKPIVQIEHIGKKTILVYSLKYSDPTSILSSIHSIVTDLKKSSSYDKELVYALDSAKYVQTSNTLVFTGTLASLEKIKPLLKKFDLPTAKKAPGPSQFFIYKPEYLNGKKLESILENFAKHLQVTGFSNDDLYNTIRNLKYREDTNTIIFTGTEKSLNEIKTLLKTFDVPGKGMPDTKKIQPIDDTSFLVYKLQYHKGDEIRAALKQIGTDLKKSNAKVKPSLLNAINSIQWIQVTNSLLCSGDQQIMSRLRELIKSLDIPLKQVFIEVLVLQTELLKALDFGLDWAAKSKIKDHFAGSINNSRNSLHDAATTTFNDTFSKVNSTTAPDPLGIPLVNGFGLGVIGDIIMHKGKSFISLGSLIKALQNDSESSIMMTPKILTQDGKTASIFIGRNIPYTGSFIQNQGSNVVTTKNLEYRDIGLNMTITPVLGNTDTVTLDIQIQKTQELPASSSSNTDIQGITTSKTEMNTTVHMPNSHFLALSGMAHDVKTRQKQGIPCLGSLPLIGAAFSESLKGETKDNIVIFIRPHIINSYKDMSQITNNQESFFRDHAGTPTLERDFDENLEVIKSIDDD